MSNTPLINICPLFYFLLASCLIACHSKKIPRTSANERAFMDYPNLSIDSSKIKILNSFSFNDAANVYFENSKEVAVEILISDLDLLGNIFVDSALFEDDDYDFFIFLDENGKMAQNQNYRWDHPEQITHGIVLDAVNDSVKTINLIDGREVYPRKFWNKKPLNIPPAALPFKEADFYKSRRVHEIKGYLEMDLSPSNFAVKFWKDGSNSEIYLIDISADSISYELLPLQNLSLFSKNETSWIASSWKRIAISANNTAVQRKLYSGNLKDGFDFEKCKQRILKGRNEHLSIFFGTKPYFFNSVSVSHLPGDTLVVDSSFFTILEEEEVLDDVYELGGQGALSKINYAPNKFGIRAANKVFIHDGKNWKKIMQIDELKSRFESSFVLNDKGFYFTAGRKAYYHNYKKTTEILTAYSNIMKISGGPEDAIIFDVGGNKDELIAGIYYEDSKKVFPIPASKVHNLLQTSDFHFVKYREITNSILVLTSLGLYEFDFEEVVFK